MKSFKQLHDEERHDPYDPTQHPPGHLYLGYPDIALYKFSPEELQSINLESIGPANENLAGHIETENWIDISTIDSLVTPIVTEADSAFLYHSIAARMFIDDLHPPILAEAWANRQKKYEFNPIHDHAGIYSFVIWYDIPYTREEENEASPYIATNTKNRNRSGMFSYCGPRGIWTDLAGSKDWNGVMAIFNSRNTLHTVYPFYSTDKERITISGNYAYVRGESK